MLTTSQDFVENTEYGYAVARIRALETKFVADAGFNALLTARDDNFIVQCSELTGIGTAKGNVPLLLDDLVESLVVQRLDALCPAMQRERG